MTAPLTTSKAWYNSLMSSSLPGTSKKLSLQSFDSIGIKDVCMEEPRVCSSTRKSDLVFLRSTSPLLTVTPETLSRLSVSERSEERRVGKECRSRWSLYH